MNILNQTSIATSRFLQGFTAQIRMWKFWQRKYSIHVETPNVQKWQESQCAFLILKTLPKNFSQRMRGIITAPEQMKRLH